MSFVDGFRINDSSTLRRFLHAQSSPGLFPTDSSLDIIFNILTSDNPVLTPDERSATTERSFTKEHVELVTHSLCKQIFSHGFVVI